MLTSMKKMLNKAYQEGYAVPAFNVDNYEIMKSIINAAEKVKSPVILMFTTSAIKYYGLKNLIDVASNLATESIIEVATHLDHQPDLEVCKKAVDYKITSVMLDASHFSYEKNTVLVKKLCDYISQKDISVEAELGQISGIEDWKKANEVVYTKKEEARSFFKDVKIDCLAIAIGTAHGIYQTKPILNISLLKEINELVKKPLVLHGGSGLALKEIRSCIQNGISKVNFGTEIKIDFAKHCQDFARKNELSDVRKMLTYAMEKLEKLIIEKIKICQSEGKSNELRVK